MKNSIGLIVAFATTIISVQAQTVSSKKVPTQVKSALEKSHSPITKIKWEMEGLNYEARFSLKGIETTEVYTPAGRLIETETSIKFSELPLLVQAKLKGLKMTETAKIVKADGTVVYEAEVKGKDLLFDANGNLVK